MERQPAIFENNDFFSSLPVECPDSCVRLIQEKLAAKWHLLGFQCFYYGTLDNTEQPQNLVFAHLDAMDRVAPNDSTRAFLQMVRGERLTNAAQFDSAKPASPCATNAPAAACTK